MSDYQTAREFAQYIKALGFRTFVAGALGGEGPRGYGFITDADGTRVLGFEMREGRLGGNYNGDRQCGTGWRMDQSTWELKTADDVRKALYALAPGWTGFNASARHCPTCGQSTGVERKAGSYTTLDQHLALYGKSSLYREL